MISQLENASANRRQRSVVARSLALLQLPKLKSEVLSNLLGKGQQNRLSIALPGYSRVLWGSFFLVAPGRDVSTNPEFKYTSKCIFLSSGNCSNWAQLIRKADYPKDGEMWKRIVAGQRI